MATERILNTRIQLKYDTYANWKTNNPILKIGEYAAATIPAEDNSGVSTTLPTVLLKVGDGVNHYNDLKFVAAPAADVYEWAKAETKPTYAATEITGLAEFIGTEIQDTDTQYQLVKVNDYEYKLQSKPLNGTWTDVAGSNIVIPNKTDEIAAIVADVAALQGLVGNETVSNQIDKKIEALDLANTYDAKGAAAQALTDAKGYADGLNTAMNTRVEAAEGKIATLTGAESVEGSVAKALKDAKDYADTKVGSVAKGNDGIVIGGTATAPTVGVQIDDTVGNSIQIVEGKGLRVEIPAAAEYSIVKDETSGDFAAVYHLTKDGVNTGAAINIPKDMVVQSGSVVTNPEGQPAGTYIKLVLQNVENPLYINVGSLIEYVTSGSQTGDMVVVTVSDDHKVTATITDGTINREKLAAGVQTSLGLADNSVQKEAGKRLMTDEEGTKLEGIEAGAQVNVIGTVKVNGVALVPDAAKAVDVTVPTGALASKDKVAEGDLEEALATKINGKADQTTVAALDQRVQVVEGKAHEHTNKTELDKIAEGDKAKWDAAVQTVTAGSGLKATKTGTDVAIDFDEAVTLVFQCGTSVVESAQVYTEGNEAGGSTAII